MSMEISEKDKQLLYIVAAVLILAAAFFFGFKNFTDQKDQYKEQTKTYNDEYTQLIELQKNRTEYQNLTEQYKIDRVAILEEFEDGYNQENIIKTISDIETQDSIWIKEMSFDESAVVYEFTSEKGLLGVENVMDMKFEGGYEEFKLLLKSLLDINSKTMIDKVKVKYKEDTQTLEGEISLKHYSVGTLLSEGPAVKIDLSTGVSNIFDSNVVTSNTQTSANAGSYILSDYDICTIISPDDATIDSVIVGTTNDAKAKDSLSSDKNETVELTITVDGKEGKYTVSYKLGDETYPAKKYEKGVSFEPGDTLDLLILSSARNGDKDKVAVKANLINNSDMKLNVLVSGDDASSPRFTAVTREGDITIYR